MTDVTARLSTALADRYQIQSRLGEGGMATVYLANDLKHDRKVALKVLKAELAAVLGAERFVQEIKTTASLQHPHILPLFDSGEADSFLFYVMPFIDGETLRAKLDRETQLSIEEAVKITSEVADALHYAHEQGVIHRDIKPENILMHNGRPMVADFGIALAVSAAAGGRMTETGLSLGTPHYMSPEQATAEKDLSARSDIYSLGSVLYEMLTGDPPHTGSSAQQIIMKIVTDEARLVTELRKSVPPNVAAATARALEKLPADRFDSAKGFADALANAAFTIPTMGAMVEAGAARADWRQRTAVPALVLAVLLLLTTLWSVTNPSSPVAVTRYEVALPVEQALSANVWSRITVSPDGSRLAYIGPNGTILVRARDQLGAIELTGTEGAFNPFFSPDGTRVGFMDGPPGNARVKSVGVVGGSPVLVTDSSVGAPGATWGYDGFIYYDASGVGPLRRVPENGGISETISTLDTEAGERQHIWPDALPNGRGVVMTLSRGGPGQQGSDVDDVAVLDLATGQHNVLARGVYGRYAKSGHLLYVTADGVLMAAPFDQGRLEVTGASVAVISGIAIRSGGGGVDLTISDGGTLWYGEGEAFGLEREVVWATKEGVLTPVDPTWIDNIGSIALSPNGSQLAVEIARDGRNIWVKELDAGPLNKVTFEGDNIDPAWHPDGGSVIFSASRESGVSSLYSVRADGGALPRLLVENERSVSSGRWSDDGMWVIYHTPVPEQNVYGFRPAGDSASTPLLMADFAELEASVSPDGRWLLFSSEQTGQSEVYVRPFPDTEGPLRLISTNGGYQPGWSRSGRSIFYRSFESDLIEVEVVPGETFRIGEPRVLFAMGRVGDWDVTDDDQFIMVRDRSEQQDRGNLIVVENFFEELREKVGRE